MMMLHDGWHDGRRTALTSRLKCVRAFHHAPAVVSALMRKLDHFPNVLTDISDPGLAGLWIEREPPGISKPVCPDLRQRARCIHEWIVLGDRIVSPRIGMVHVQAHHYCVQVREVLAGIIDVGPA